MDKGFRVLSARTTKSNTPESDLMPRVMHTVSVMIDTTRRTGSVQTMATDPMDAIEKVNRWPLHLVQQSMKEEE